MTATIKKPIEKAVQLPDVQFVAMAKNGVTTKVHPSCVQSHQSAGWQLA